MTGEIFDQDQLPPWPEYGVEGRSDCWVHCRSEKIPRNVYVVCFECGHVWTRWSLYRAWVREWETMQPVDFTWRERLRSARRRWLTRPRRIDFCQECVHDF